MPVRVKAIDLGWTWTATRFGVQHCSPKGQVLTTRELCLWLEFENQEAADTALAERRATERKGATDGEA